MVDRVLYMINTSAARNQAYHLVGWQLRTRLKSACCVNIPFFFPLKTQNKTKYIFSDRAVFSQGAARHTKSCTDAPVTKKTSLNSCNLQVMGTSPDRLRMALFLLLETMVYEVLFVAFVVRLSRRLLYWGYLGWGIAGRRTPR